MLWQRSGKAWSQAALLTLSSPAANDSLGISVAMSSTYTIVAGAYKAMVTGNKCGAVSGPVRSDRSRVSALTASLPAALRPGLHVHDVELRDELDPVPSHPGLRPCQYFPSSAGQLASSSLTTRDAPWSVFAQVANDQHGYCVSIAGSGKYLAIGAPRNDGTQMNQGRP